MDVVMSSTPDTTSDSNKSARVQLTCSPNSSCKHFSKRSSNSAAPFFAHEVIERSHMPAVMGDAVDSVVNRAGRTRGNESR